MRFGVHGLSPRRMVEKSWHRGSTRPLSRSETQCGAMWGHVIRALSNGSHMAPLFRVFTRSCNVAEVKLLKGLRCRACNSCNRQHQEPPPQTSLGHPQFPAAAPGNANLPIGVVNPRSNERSRTPSRIFNNTSSEYEISQDNYTASEHNPSDDREQKPIEPQTPPWNFQQVFGEIRLKNGLR